MKKLQLKKEVIEKLDAGQSKMVLGGATERFCVSVIPCEIEIPTQSRGDLMCCLIATLVGSGC